MGRITTSFLRHMILVFLAANVSIHAGGCSPRKACTVLKGRCIQANQECEGQEVKNKVFCKGRKCKCCFPQTVIQPPCPTIPQPPPTTPTPTKPPPVEVPNFKPIIGILAQEMSSKMKEILPQQYNSYIGDSYVKFIESGGARVVPILINQNDSYYETMVQSLNGIVFPGGSNSITSSGYGRAGRKLYDLVVASGNNGNPIPLWGTCLGFQMIMSCAANRQKVLTECKGVRSISLPLDLKDWRSSSLLGSAPENILQPLTTMNITANYHKWCVLPQTFAKYNMNDDYLMVSTNLDTEGLEFISTVEHKTLPIWGAQWHIEKHQFEWKSSWFPHSPEAIQVAHYFAQFFGDQARQNSNSLSSKTEERNALIYNYDPIYMTPYYYSDGYFSSFQHVYVFE